MKHFLCVAILIGAQCGVCQDCTRTIPASLLDLTEHHPIPTLEGDRLHGSLQDNPVVISKIEKIRGNRILLLIDVSGSQESDRLFMQSLLKFLLEKTPPGSPIALGFFNDGLLSLSGFLHDARELSAAVDTLRSIKMHGDTALFDALHQGLKLFQTPIPSDTILVLSDGGENHSKITEGSLTKELRTSGVRIFAMLQARANFSSPEEITGPQALNSFATQTGVYVMPLLQTIRNDKKSRTELVDAVRTFWLDGVGSGYLLTVQVPVDIKKNTRWKLKLDKGPDKLLKNVTVLYPNQLTPCAIMSGAAAH
jgi:hypothetical protein